MIGEALAHFRIVAKPGEGGMGEVYRATDTRLGREVAVKVLPEQVASDAERLHQLERYDDARKALTGFTVEWAGRGAEASLALGLLAAGDDSAAREILAGIDPAVDGFLAGLVELALGETDVAFGRFSDLRRLDAWPCIAVHHLYRDVWETVHGDPRLETLVRHAYASHGMDPPERRADD